MSTDTQNSPNPGQRRRRRSNGGNNRNENNNSNRGNSTGRQSGGGNRSDRNDQSKPARRPMPAPVLTWWQKILKAVGLYKEPVRPPRPERRPDSPKSGQSNEPRKTKTRDARSDQQVQPQSREPRENNQRSEKRRERGDRNERSDRNNDRGDRDGRPRGGDPSTVESRRVYVGNLSYETSESDLEELFKGVGAVRRVEIVYNRNTHRSKGYGFIEMLDIDEAKRCVEVLHEQFFMGRKLTVSGAKSKDYESAESDEKTPIADTIPQLAPINPVKEEVTDLISDTSEVPMEEFVSEPVTSEEVTAEVATLEDTASEESTTEEIKS